MNSLKFFRAYCQVFSRHFFPHIPNYKPALKNIVPTSILFGSIFVSAPGVNKEVTPRKKKSANYVKQIKTNCIGSEKKINELILTLGDAITDTCEKYRASLQKQIDVMEGGLQKDPLDQYWDKLIPLRLEADNLKKDFESYRSMIEYVGQLAFNLAFCSALISNLDSKDYVCNEYFNLEKIAKEQVAENKRVEEILLKKNVQGILNTANTAKVMQEVASELKKTVKKLTEEQEKLIQEKILKE